MLAIKAITPNNLLGIDRKMHKKEENTIQEHMFWSLFRVSRYVIIRCPKLLGIKDTKKIR